MHLPSILSVLFLLLAMSYPSGCLGENTGQPERFTGVFYQPLVSDLVMSEDQWQQIFLQLEKDGGKRLFLQWSRHGEVDFLKTRLVSGQELLPALTKLAHKFGCKLVVGLYADPDFFGRIGQSGASLQVYLKRLRLLSLDQAKAILQVPGITEVLDGWYLYEEIDDLNWREKERRQLLAEHLQLSQKGLAELAPGCRLYLSTFFSGQMAPQHFATMWSGLLQDSSYQLMVQDGAGTGGLRPDARGFYFSEMSRQVPGSRWLPVVEFFAAAGEGQQFQAETITFSEQGKRLELLRQHNPRPPVVFSLRYLWPQYFPSSGS